MQSGTLSHCRWQKWQRHLSISEMTFLCRFTHTVIKYSRLWRLILIGNEKSWNSALTACRSLNVSDALAVPPWGNRCISARRNPAAPLIASTWMWPVGSNTGDNWQQRIDRCHRRVRRESAGRHPDVAKMFGSALGVCARKTFDNSGERLGGRLGTSRMSFPTVSWI